MLAVTADTVDAERPLDGLRVGERPDPTVPDGWVTVDVRAASLNHHDIWTLRGVGVERERLPIVLGCDAAGTIDGREVIVHSIISSPTAKDDYGSELLDPNVSMLSERHDGTLAQRVVVPPRNLIDKPPELSFEEAACLPTAYLTAYHALFTQAGLRTGDSVLIQGAGGGFATAAVLIGKAAGITVMVTSRSDERRERALALGADVAVSTGARLPERVDAVLESVGAATWAHSLRSLRPGGSVVVVGATSGFDPPADLQRIFYRQLRILGSLMGTREELAALVSLLVSSGTKPLIDTTRGLADARGAFEQMLAGAVFGKLVMVNEG